MEICPSCGRVIIERIAAWADWRGRNYTSAQVVEFLARACGSSITVEQLERTYRVGSEYRNGDVYFQRLS